MFEQLGIEQGINQNGCGLGLTICSNLTNKLGGKISVNSQEGRGSTFNFYILAH